MLDAGFLEAEDSDRHVSLAIGSVSVLEGPIPDDDAFVSGLAERVLAVPRFRQVLRTHPLDLEAPEWVDAENFDISHHVHRVALPHPGDDVALFRLTADVMERRLDRERPLWECWIVEGLPDNQWAMIMKLHHCIADGIATMHMLAGLSDGGEGDTYATAIRAAKAAGKTRIPVATAKRGPAAVGRRRVAHINGADGRRQAGLGRNSRDPRWLTASGTDVAGGPCHDDAPLCGCRGVA